MRTFATDTITTQGPRMFLASLAASASQPLNDTVTLTWLTDDTVTRVHCAALPCDWVELLEACLGNAGQAGCEQLIVTVHASRPAGNPMPFTAEVADLRAMVEPCGMNLLDVLLVDGNRFWSYLCTDESCCPIQGTAVVLDEVVPPPFPLATVTAEAIEQADTDLGGDLSARADAAWQALQHLAGGDADPSAASVLVAAVRDINVRDYVMVKVRAAGDREGLLARTMAAVALAIVDGCGERLAAAAAMSLLASGAHPQPIRELLVISGEESLARLVQRALDGNVPARVAAESLDAAAGMCIEAVTKPAA